VDLPDPGKPPINTNSRLFGLVTCIIIRHASTNGVPIRVLPFAVPAAVCLRARPGRVPHQSHAAVYRCWPGPRVALTIGAVRTAGSRWLRSLEVASVGDTLGATGSSFFLFSLFFRGGHHAKRRSCVGRGHRRGGRRNRRGANRRRASERQRVDRGRVRPRRATGRSKIKLEAGTSLSQLVILDF